MKREKNSRNKPERTKELERKRHCWQQEKIFDCMMDAMACHFPCVMAKPSSLLLCKEFILSAPSQNLGSAVPRIPKCSSRDYRTFDRLSLLKGKEGNGKTVVRGHQGSGGGATNADKENAELVREVGCQVEAVSWRERHISASVSIEASEERVWEVLTDYGRLAEFIPNLTRRHGQYREQSPTDSFVCLEQDSTQNSEQIPCPHPGRIWLLQEGRQAAMYWHIEARVVLDLLELPQTKDGKELRFSMVDGDFKRYVGRWYLRPSVRPGMTDLHYEVNVTPRLFFPAAFVERIIRADLPTNLRAMAERAEDCTNLSQGARSLQLKPSAVTLVHPSLSKKAEVDGTVTPSQGSVAPVGKTKQGGKGHSWGGVGQSCKLGKPCAVDEVHLRRYDDLLENGGVHRRVVAAITVEAPVCNVWAVLTAYKNLPEFIPNLAICEVLSRDKNRVRLLQEGCKCLLYMVLHARVVLDLWERPQYEIIFQQVEGDFDSFQGKWTLEPLGTQHTLLKYVVDTRMHKDSLLAEAIVEEVIYEDLPANLCAIRDWVESHGIDSIPGSPGSKNLTHMTDECLEECIVDEDAEVTRENDLPDPTPSKDVSTAVGNSELCSRLRAFQHSRKRPLVAGLQRNFNILEIELMKFIAEEGTEGVMPMRCELRDAGRVDLEKAIARMGGFGPVATKLNLSLAYKQRKPRGYWDNLQNVHKEIVLFQKEQGKDRMHMPTRKSLERAGRYDLARSLEKWGGLQEVARVLGLQVRKRQKVQSAKMPAQLNKDALDNEADLKLPFKTALPPKSTKWVTMRRGSGFDFNNQ